MNFVNCPVYNITINHIIKQLRKIVKYYKNRTFLHVRYFVSQTDNYVRIPIT